MNKALAGNFDIKHLKQWQFSWFLMLYGAILLKNLWFIAAAVFIVANVKIPVKSVQRVYFYLALICTLPLISVQIPGFAGIKNLFPLSYTNLMIMSLLLPLFFNLKSPQKLFSIPTDKFIFSFIVLLSLLQFRDNTITNAGRESFLLFIDIFVPYFVITRLINTPERLKMALTALFIGIIPFAALGVFEVITNWLVYIPMMRMLDDTTANLYRDIRGGGVRASLLMGPIVVGYTMIYAGALLLYLQHFIKNRRLVFIAFSIIFLCLLASKSRGPWIGFALMIMMFLWTGRDGFSKLVKYGILGVLLLILASLTPAGSKYVGLLPFIGDERTDTFDYRVRLIENSEILFKKNPLFGDINFRSTPEMESLRQGQGIIDVVNTYIGILLPYGLIALSLFVGVFLFLMFRCRKIIKRPDIDIESKLMGRIFISCIAGVMFTIFTVSSISYIPTFYWVLIALSSAYININKTAKVGLNHELS
ncbi:MULTISPECIES: O-antigen ligase family protein [unclassified Methylophaga]|uniref:O-antigen ligase family protein n=1 Tax=unclassified Methylophaga TaxID=2629249 RepID=UPI0025D6A74B|nr:MULTISPECIES: O-antigen ligase family protein [unclassified Methylophaga]|tara:strand:+ start:18747 stop:20177 length:1431 start_codon:yes stop_codon:yes gene_type:complete